MDAETMNLVITWSSEEIEQFFNIKDIQSDYQTKVKNEKTIS